MFEYVLVINIIFGMPGVNCAVVGCGSCRGTKGIEILSCPRRRMINTRDGVMNGLENSRKRGKWTKIFDEKSMKTKSMLAKSISRMK